MKVSLRHVIFATVAVAVTCSSSSTRNPPAVEAAQEHTFAASAGVVPKEPFKINDGLIPPSWQYQGPTFNLSHDWPSQPLPPLNNPPWQVAIGGRRITTQNADAYVDALKKYVGVNARTLLLNYKEWDAAKAHWYNEPWLGSKRESIHGTYAAGQFGPSIFPGTGLTTTFDTHVLTYYDERAAYTLFKVWKATAANPDVTTENFQFPEGSVIVKVAVFVSDDPAVQGNWWPVTDGAAIWPIYTDIPAQTGAPHAMLNSYVMQFDIIVKDSIAAPQTGWVFSTLVYDKNAKDDKDPEKELDPWDKMVALGAMWGNDPGVDPEAHPEQNLKENWINPKAPAYSTQTLGWGGRLSGPNDGARNDIQVGDQVLANHRDSSCMSCHSPAEWQPAQHRQLSFLLPSYANTLPAPPFKPCPIGDPSGPYICSPAPASQDWWRWFQSHPGTEPLDPNTGSVATDYDMVFAFKTLPMWWAAMGAPGAEMPFAMDMLSHGSHPAARYNEYSGAPLKPTL